MNARILTVGEALTDIVIRPGEEPKEFPGGSPMNVAVALGRMGHDSWLLTDIADDERGHAIRSHVESSHVTLTQGSVKSDTHTSTAEATIGEDGAATYEFTIRWDPDPILLPGHVNAVHTSSIGATLEPGVKTVCEVLETYRKTSLISYDPNARPSLMGDPADVRRIVESHVAVSDVVKSSDEDLEWLYGHGNFDAIASDWLNKGVKLVVVTRGGEGASGYTAAGRVDVPGRTVEVADTVGAGDTFSAGLIDALARKGLLGVEHREELGALSESEIRTILEHAALLASVTVSRAGANPPWDSEIADVTPLKAS